MNRFHIVYAVFIVALFLLGCDNQAAEIPAGTYAERVVTQVSEADLIANAGYAAIPDLEVPPQDGDVHITPAVAIYCDHRSSAQWYPLQTYAYRISNGTVWIDTASGNSNNYRVVVVK
jgi:uncharacterized lipoprotein NlpE involved in copper resistance